MPPEPKGTEIVLFNVDELSSVRRYPWLNDNINRVATKSFAKFMSGACEHRCDIGAQTVEYLLNQIEDEAIDTLMYVAELRRRIKSTETSKSHE